MDFDTSSGDSGRTTFDCVTLGTFFTAYTFFLDSFILLRFGVSSGHSPALPSVGRDHRQWTLLLDSAFRAGRLTHGASSCWQRKLSGTPG